MRTGETIADGQTRPEAEVNRQAGGETPFQVRAAVTVRQGFRGRGKRPDPGPGQTFQVREAVTVTLPPPHWATLTQQEETDHVPQSGPDANCGQD